MCKQYRPDFGQCSFEDHLWGVSLLNVPLHLSRAPFLGLLWTVNASRPLPGNGCEWNSASSHRSVNVPCTRRCCDSEAAPCHSPSSPSSPLSRDVVEKEYLPCAASTLRLSSSVGSGGLCPAPAPLLSTGSQQRTGFAPGCLLTSCRNPPSVLRVHSSKQSEACEEQMAFCDENSIFLFTFSNAIRWRVESQCILFCSPGAVYGTFIY